MLKKAEVSSMSATLLSSLYVGAAILSQDDVDQVFHHRGDRNGSHADDNVPIGGYFCPSRSIVGPQVHHSVEGISLITPGTWFPQPHHVVLSRYCQTSFKTQA